MTDPRLARLLERFDPPPPLPPSSPDSRDRLLAHLLEEHADAKRGFALFGIPHDAAVISRPGAREGPRAIRERLRLLRPWRAGQGEVPLVLRDLGDVRLPPAGEAYEPREAWLGEQTELAHHAVHGITGDLRRLGFVPVALGGDHSFTHPLAATAGARPIGVVNIDAHLDLREIQGRITSGTPFGRLIEDGALRGENLAEIGIRDFVNSPYYGNKAKSLGVQVVSPREARQDFAATARAAVEAASAGTSGVYVSLDMDVLDQADGPGVSAPSPGGFTSAELLDLMVALAREIRARTKLLGFDVMEVAPPHDVDGRTARAAAFALLAFLSEHGTP